MKIMIVRVIFCLLTVNGCLISMERPEDLLRLFQEESNEPEVICDSCSDGVFSPDGSKILSQNRLMIYETKRSNYALGLECARDISSENSRRKGRWSPQGSYVYAKGKRLQFQSEQDKWWERLFVWNAKNGQLLSTIAYITTTDRATFTRDEKYFLVNGIGRQLEVYDINDRVLKARLGQKDTNHKILPQPPQGQFIVNFEYPHTHFYDAIDFRELTKIEGTLRCFSDDGKTMVIDQGYSEKKENNGIVVCDCDTLQLLRRFKAGGPCLYKNDQLLSDGFIHNVVTGKELYKKEEHLPCSSIQSYPSLDLSKIVHLNSDNKKTQVTITHLDGTVLQSLTLDAEVKNVRFDYQGKYAVLGNFDDIIAIVSLKTGKIVRQYKEHESSYFGFWQHPEKPLPLFSRDGKFLDVSCDQYRNRWARILKLAE